MITEVVDEKAKASDRNPKTFVCATGANSVTIETHNVVDVSKATMAIDQHEQGNDGN